MITAIMMRHYKNYSNVRFVPIINDTKNMFSIYVGNNGVGKSAILEALDVVLNNHRTWNITQGAKRTEAYICPVFLIPKSSVPQAKKKDLETISNFFWSDEPDRSSVARSNSEIKKYIDYKNSLKEYEKTHYLIMIGVSNDVPGAFFGSFEGSVKSLLGENKDDQIKRSNAVKELVLEMYSYLYIPVEESPANLLQLQHETMQKLLNKDVQLEIERILNKKQEKTSIVTQINKNLDTFINDVNAKITEIDESYSFSPEFGSKKKLTAKDIRTKIIEAFFPLRSLKKGSRSVDLLSSGEQRRAVIDVAYSTLMANKDKKTERNIILAIDEPEISMHISNCFDQFSRLEELAEKNIQVIVTTHWYGYLPIAQHGNMHYLELSNNQTTISSFDLYNLMEKRRSFPEDVELKSMFDLASSLVSYMRRQRQHKWIFCEGSDDKLYLEAMLEGYKDLYIIPVGGCGNVVKLYQILASFMSEKSEKAKSDALFLIDTDRIRIAYREPFTFSGEKLPISLKRLQIVDDTVNLVNPSSPGEYSQTEMEDCLDPHIYYDAISRAIEGRGDRSLKTTFKKYAFVQGASTSMIRGDNSCIQASDSKYISKKQQILDFVEADENKIIIAEIYRDLCKGKVVKHKLAELIASKLCLTN